MSTIPRRRLVAGSAVITACCLALTAWLWILAQPAPGAPVGLETFGLAVLTTQATSADELPSQLDRMVDDLGINSAGARLGADQRGTKYYVAPGRVPGSGQPGICLIEATVIGGQFFGSATCNPPSVLESFGAIPSGSTRLDGSMTFSAVVPNGFTGARGSDGRTARIAGNVLVIELPAAVDEVQIQGSAGQRTLQAGVVRSRPE